jgi:hypothetical protein
VTVKLFGVMFYAIAGFLMAAAPAWVGRRGHAVATPALPVSPHPVASDPNRSILPVLASVAGVAALFVTHSQAAQLPWVVILGVMGVYLAQKIQNEAAALESASALLLGLIVGGTLIWWNPLAFRPPEQGAPDRMLVAVLIALFIVALLARRAAPDSPTRVWPGAEKILLTAWALIAVWLSVTLTVFTEGVTRATAWHHWSAYIGPAELLLEGVRPLVDMPVQYGTGPTVLIAALCGTDCWPGAWASFAFAIAAHTLLIGVFVFLVRPRDGRWPLLGTALLLAAALAACIFWSAWPLIDSSPVGTPSVSGMRFLPAELMLAWILFSPRRLPRAWVPLAHLGWLCCWLWSPEAGFQATLIWWPIALFDRASPGPLAPRLWQLSRTAAGLLSLGAASILAVVIIIRLVAGDWPSMRLFAAYLLAPPNESTFRLDGTLWFFLLTTLLGLLTAWQAWRQSGDDQRFRQSLGLQLLLWGASSYYLGDSSDNNLLNMLPFMVPVLTDTLAQAPLAFSRWLSATLLAAVLGWLPFINWQAWQAGLSSGRLLDLDIGRQLATFRYKSMSPEFATATQRWRSAAAPLPYASAARLIRQIEARGEPWTVFDRNNLLPYDRSGPPWLAAHGPANLLPLRSPERQETLARVARRLNRSGWIILADDYLYPDIMADIESVYRRTEEIPYEGYVAIRFEPRR